MRLPLRSAAAAILAASIQAASAAPCSLQPVQPHGDNLTFGAYKIHLENGDESDNTPPAWEGPADITGPSGQSCSVGLAIISPPFFGAGDHIIYISSYSGSEVSLSAVDLRNCNVPWFSPNYTGEARIAHGDTFTYLDAPPTPIGPNCLPPGVKP